MLTIYIIFILSLVCAERVWNFSVELERRHYGRKVEVFTMLAGCIILGVGEIAVTNHFLKSANQQPGVEEALLEYAMLISLVTTQVIATIATMKKYKRISDKLTIFGISLFCLLVGSMSELIK